MLLLQITPWGFITPGSAAVVVDDPDLGQRLWLCAHDENDLLFPFGPDFMPVAWMDKAFWAPGIVRLDKIGDGPGLVLIIDFWDPKSEKYFSEALEGSNALKLADIFTPSDKKLIGQLWAIDPNGEVHSDSFSLSLDASSHPTFKPHLRVV